MHKIQKDIESVSGGNDATDEKIRHLRNGLLD